MFESSRLHGLHQLAKKLMMKGLPSFESLAVSMVFPSMVRSVTEGSCAKAVPMESIKSAMAEERNLFMFVCGGVNAGNDGGKAVLSFCAISAVCMIGGMIYGLVMDVVI